MLTPTTADPALATGRGELPVLAVRGAGKSYGPIRALDGVDVAFLPGEVHALVGENGAGKSTLKRLIAGETQPDGGAIEIDGAPIRLDDPGAARRMGIAVVHQHFPMCESMTVAENLALGDPSERGAGWLRLLDRRRMTQHARAALSPFGLERLAGRTVRELGVAERQIVAIGAALAREARVIVLDEPTSSLNAREVEILFDNMRRIRSAGRTIVFITHFMNEVLAVADRVTVLRDGRLIGTVPVAEVDAKRLVRMIVGRDLAERTASTQAGPGETLLAARDIDVGGRRPVAVEVRTGEVLGLPAHMGSGVDDLLSKVAGGRPARGGAIDFAGCDIGRTPIARRIRAGICLVPGDATREGLIPKLSIEQNILLANRRAFSRLGVLDLGEARRVANAMIRQLDIRPATPWITVEQLSGGNRQKVVIAKWLAAGARLLVMDDPTKGVDVGAKFEIYSTIADFVSGGRSVMLGSSDIDELINVCDRIVVIRDGELRASYPRGRFDKVAILDDLIGGAPSVLHPESQ